MSTGNKCNNNKQNIVFGSIKNWAITVYFYQMKLENEGQSLCHKSMQTALENRKDTHKTNTEWFNRINLYLLMPSSHILIKSS